MEKVAVVELYSLHAARVPNRFPSDWAGWNKPLRGGSGCTARSAYDRLPAQIVAD